MDYLRTLGSAAVSSLVQKSGLNLPFSLGAKVATFEGIYNLYEGTKRDDGSLVSVFEYEFSDPAKKNVKAFATNALRKLRTTRHPDVLKFMDAVETDTNVYIMTERVRPLQTALQAWTSRDAREKEDWLLWGIHRISVALVFLNDPCFSSHGKICVNAIFISPSGEWKLGGFELFSNTKEESPILYTMGGMYPSSSSWASPEVKKGGWSVLKEHGPGVVDSYSLGLLLHAVFNPTHPEPPTAQPPHPPPTPASRGSIPTSVFPSFKKLLNPNPKARLSAKSFLEVGMAETGFFATNRLVKVCAGLDNFALSNEAEKNTLLRTLKESAVSFPPEFTSNRVLPSLVSALEYGGASAATILPLVLQFGANVSSEEYPNAVLAPLIKLYASPDRGTRMALLDHLAEYADRLDKKTVSDKIFPHLSTGFSDTIAVIREATTKSIILLAPKLSDRILNNDLLRFLAKMQTDPEASIRTNTCILIGRLGPSLGYHTKRKVLVPAFTRALKDPFVHARVAALMAFMATIDCFDTEDLATKVIPNIASALVDKEKLVRDQAFKAVDLFVKRLETHASTMPETALTDPSDPTAVLPEQATLVNSAAGAAGALAGWAISSLGKKLVTSDLQSAIGANPATASGDRPTSAPPPPGGSSLDSQIGNLGPKSMLSVPKTMSAASTPLASPAFQSTSRSKGMQLGASKVPPSVAAAVLAEQLAEEVAISEGDSNPWGNDDLIDVNADADDWSAFESAPAPTIIEPKPRSAVGLGFNGIGNGTPTTSHPPGARPRINSTNFPSRASTPIPSPPPIDTASWDSPETGWDVPAGKSSPSAVAVSMSGMSKEEKAAEMARRKEERKQRIALLKEQKKNAVR